MADKLELNLASVVKRCPEGTHSYTHTHTPAGGPLQQLLQPDASVTPLINVCNVFALYLLTLDTCQCALASSDGGRSLAKVNPKAIQPWRENPAVTQTLFTSSCLLFAPQVGSS